MCPCQRLDRASVSCPVSLCVWSLCWDTDVRPVPDCASAEQWLVFLKAELLFAACWKPHTHWHVRSVAGEPGLHGTGFNDVLFCVFYKFIPLHVRPSRFAYATASPFCFYIWNHSNLWKYKHNKANSTVLSLFPSLEWRRCWGGALWRGSWHFLRELRDKLIPKSCSQRCPPWGQLSPKNLRGSFLSMPKGLHFASFLIKKKKK